LRDLQQAKEGFSMSSGVPQSSGQGSSDFQKVADAFLSGEGLPFAEVLSAERIERIFAKHSCQFGVVYTAAITLWAFLSQVLRDRKEAACQAAVARVVSFCLLVGRPAPTSDTGNYCRARLKLSEAAIHELSVEVAAELEQTVDPSWL
jgi:hypothetical protein